MGPARGGLDRIGCAERLRTAYGLPVCLRADDVRRARSGGWALITRPEACLGRLGG
ncbi:hypothetical protein [Streptomyces sp. 130]|uniref:hypothetical protein n=1 Tax=Streptomyces sp. 130 TaxID=2591006 RepID=UPI00163D6B3F|nr:hypothetical protein [Streptomyces sp. 130]